ncbi:hypothetical protein ANN_13860 [Periplaneta americana]|uniref:Uncharacterized protein n=1 Tax=Periplaneta americana TaxID=6978 RepID=A0ABQ8SUP4_PERAM|nr:hypothetical protein ANN_13860 [Periplaneta americana]
MSNLKRPSPDLDRTTFCTTGEPISSAPLFRELVALYRLSDFSSRTVTEIATFLKDTELGEEVFLEVTGMMLMPNVGKLERCGIVAPRRNQCSSGLFSHAGARATGAPRRPRPVAAASHPARYLPRQGYRDESMGLKCIKLQRRGDGRAEGQANSTRSACRTALPMIQKLQEKLAILTMIVIFLLSISQKHPGRCKEDRLLGNFELLYSMEQNEPRQRSGPGGDMWRDYIRQDGPMQSRCGTLTSERGDREDHVSDGLICLPRGGETMVEDSKEQSFVERTREDHCK